jgi:cbb3-type cytochrome oxidase maturation protein
MSAVPAKYRTEVRRYRPPHEHMEILLLLIPLGIALVAFAGAALVWALYDGQYDALDQVGQRMPDDDPD